MMRFFDYIDTMPDLQFMMLFVCLIVAAYAAEWLFDAWANRRSPWERFTR